MPPTTTLGDVADIRTGAPTHGRSYLRKGTDQIQVLSLQDVEPGRVACGTVTPTKDLHAMERYKVQPGDVLLTARGKPRAAVAPDGIDAYIDSGLVRVRTKDYPPHLLAAVLNSEHGRNQLQRLSTSSSGIFLVKAAELAKMELPIIPAETSSSLITLLAERDQWIRAAQDAIDMRQRLIDGILTNTLEDTQ